MGYQVRHLGNLSGLSGLSGLNGADALMVTVQEVTEAVLAAMPACKVVARVGTGLDSIDLDEAARRGVQVTYVADYSVDEVSTHAIALLLAWARRIPQYLDLVRAGRWDSVGAGTIRRLSEQTLGVAGFGRIGQAAAGKGRGLGLRVLVCDPYRSDGDIRAAGCEPASWEGLLAESDFIFDEAALRTGGGWIDRADLRDGVKIIERTRAAAGDDMDILLEMHSLWSPQAALTIARAVEEFGLFWIEDPFRVDSP
jgi:D-3-phosphoglycerate dehydrogenase